VLSRTAQLGLSLLALVLAAAGAWVIFGAARSAAGGPELVEVPVLLTDAAPGDVIDAGRVALRPFPAAAVRGAVLRPEELAGRTARAFIAAGVPVLPQALAAQAPGLPAGKAELVFDLPKAAALDGRLSPGDRVQVLAARRGADFAPELLGEAVVLGLAEASPGRLSVRLLVGAAEARRFAEAALGSQVAGWGIYLFRVSPGPDGSP
jgi:Flp pilus assembly protein CpaB